jgi:hypothetical protein
LLYVGAELARATTDNETAPWSHWDPMLYLLCKGPRGEREGMWPNGVRANPPPARGMG